MDKKRAIFDIKLNSIQDTDNPTRKEVEFILHDFEKNHNGSFISKETALKSLHTLEDMPIVAKYYPVSEAGADDDALGSHEVYLGEDRESGKPIIEFHTVPIGVFTEPAYIKTINENGVEKEVVAGKGILWGTRFPNAVGLLKEWNDRGIQIVSSMEILYDSYMFKDGAEEILSYVYEGHCVLNSEDRGMHDKVYPAYDVSKLTRLVAQAVGQQDSKEGENVEEVVQEVNEVEAEQVEQVEETPEEVVVESEVSETEEVAEEVADNEELTQLQNQVNELTGKVSSLSTENESLMSKLNEATDKLTQLNSLVEELKPFQEKFEKAEFEKAHEEKKEFYSAKFAAFDATEQFESEEVQGLIEKAVYENEEGKNAILQLNSMLVDMVQVKPKEENPVVREMASKREDLLPESTSFEDRYSI